MMVIYVMAFVIVGSVLIIILYYTRNNRFNQNKNQARNSNTVDEIPNVPVVKISNMGKEKDNFEISPEASQANKDFYPVNEPEELIRPEIAKKNKWLYPTNEFGKMEHGVVGDEEPKKQLEKKKKVIILDDDIV